MAMGEAPDWDRADAVLEKSLNRSSCADLAVDDTKKAKILVREEQWRACEEEPSTKSQKWPVWRRQRCVAGGEEGVLQAWPPPLQEMGYRVTQMVACLQQEWERELSLREREWQAMLRTGSACGSASVEKLRVADALPLEAAPAADDSPRTEPGEVLAPGGSREAVPPAAWSEADALRLEAQAAAASMQKQQEDLLRQLAVKEAQLETMRQQQTTLLATQDELLHSRQLRQGATASAPVQQPATEPLQDQVARLQLECGALRSSVAAARNLQQARRQELQIVSQTAERVEQQISHLRQSLQSAQMARAELQRRVEQQEAEMQRAGRDAARVGDQIGEHNSTTPVERAGSCAGKRLWLSTAADTELSCRPCFSAGEPTRDGSCSCSRQQHAAGTAEEGRAETSGDWHEGLAPAGMCSRSSLLSTPARCPAEGLQLQLQQALTAAEAVQQDTELLATALTVEQAARNEAAAQLARSSHAAERACDLLQAATGSSDGLSSPLEAAKQSSMKIVRLQEAKQLLEQQLADISVEMAEVESQKDQLALHIRQVRALMR